MSAISGKGVDKETFLQYFPLNGLLGERLFCQFDTKKTGHIDFDGFITGLAKVCRYIHSLHSLLCVRYCWSRL